jgi:hypothetical protein
MYRLDTDRFHITKQNAGVHEWHQVKFSKKCEGSENFNSNADIYQGHFQNFSEQESRLLQVKVLWFHKQGLILSSDQRRQSKL